MTSPSETVPFSPEMTAQLKAWYTGWIDMPRYRCHFDRIITPKFTKDLTGMWKAVRSKPTYGTCS